MPRLNKKSSQVKLAEQRKRMRELRKKKIKQKKRSKKDKERYALTRTEKINNSKVSARRRLNDLSYHRKHNKKNSEAQKSRLSDPVKRQLHNSRNKDAQKNRMSDPVKRQLHNLRNKDAQKSRMSDPVKRQLHNLRNKDAQKSRMSEPVKRQLHNLRNTDAKKRRMSDPVKRQLHNLQNKNAQNRRLCNPFNRLLHGLRNSGAQKRRLQNFFARQIHNWRNTTAQKSRLRDLANLLIHNSRNKTAQKRRLSDPEKRDVHGSRNLKAQAKRLSVPENREVHSIRLLEAQRRRLSVPENREVHSVRLREAQNRRLSVPENREVHSIRLREAQNRRLSVPENKEVHLIRLREAQNRRLSDPKKRKIHQMRNRIAQKRRLADHHQKRVQRSRIRAFKILRLTRNRAKVLQEKRLHFRRRKNLQSQIRRTNCLFKPFKKAIKEGPCYACDSCFRLWFKKSIKKHKVHEKNREFLSEICINFESDQSSVSLCSSCYNSARRMKVPALSLAHSSLQFPEIPDAVKKLSACEERFLCPRLVFMQIREVFGVRQYEVRGRAVNIPITVGDSVQILPRVPSETATIPIALKRRKQYKQNYMFEAVRPTVIIAAAEVLKDSEVYQNEGIDLDLDRFQSQFHCEEKDKSSEQLGESETDSDGNEEDSLERESEDPRAQLPDVETLLQSEAIVFAPGEGKQPLSLFSDEFVEAKSFIKIYGGKLVSKPEHITYQAWVKSEIMRSDRRCASSIPKLFFSALKLRTMKVARSIGFCLRKSKCKNTTITARDLLDESNLHSLTLHDSGFKIFESDRGSPAFFEGKKKEVFAMLRQLGQPSFFITSSAAELKWPELLVILSKTVDNKQISESEALSLPYPEKTRLIREDPVTCARYVDYRMRELLKIMKAENSFFREHVVLDWYFRVEFQARGSPHFHGFVWLKNAPIYRPDGNNDRLIQFIDRFVSVSSKLETELRSIQTHKHTFTCYKEKRGIKKCRFDIPFFPMQRTVILQPLDDDIDVAQRRLLKKKRDEVQDFLTKVHKEKKKMPFNDFLTQIQLSETEYFQVVRSGLKQTKVFLKRQVHETMINPYNKEMLTLNRANMDIQFILDAYSCASYVLNYVNKSRKGLSKLLYDAMEDIKRGNFSLREKFRSLGNHFLNASEFAAQEAVYYILSMPLTWSSRDCVFVNTSHPDKRVVIAKTRKELLNLPGDSSDVFAATIIDHYSQRPDELEKVCLARFACCYNYSKNKPKGKSRKTSDDDDSGDDWTEDTEEGKKDDWLPLHNNSGFIRKRQVDKILRYVRFNKESSEEDFFRENLMLFLPWKDEATDLVNINHCEKFLQNFETITQNKRPFVFSNELEEDLFRALFDACHFNQQVNEDEETDLQTSSQNEYRVYDAEHEEGDIFVDMGEIDVDVGVGKSVENEGSDDLYIPVPHLINDDDFRQLLVDLNVKQRMYLLHVLHAFKTDALPIYECVLGGAGVGKSRLITAVQQTLTRHFNSQLGTSLDKIRVLMCSFTGKAAYNVKGVTLHSAFVLNRKKRRKKGSSGDGELPPISDATLNSLRCLFRDLKLLVIDEFSQVGSRLLLLVDARMKQIFQNNLPFGGVSVLLLGDLNQLGPVKDRYIFQGASSNQYSALIGNPLWDLFHSFELTEIMRQKDDAVFARALNNLAEGSLTKEDIKLFQSRETKAQDVPAEAIRLFRTNVAVDSFNEAVLSSRKEICVARAVDTVSGQGSRQLAREALLSVENLTARDTEGLPTVLKLSPKVKYMITVNVSVPDGLVNGIVGTLVEIEKNDQGDPIRVWLFFNDFDVGKSARQALKSRPQNSLATLTPLDKEIRSVYPLPHSSVYIQRKQFPLVPAEAQTIYKSQGGTYPLVAVYLTPGLTRRELYVAFSRCTSLSGLFLVGKFCPPRPPDPFDEVTLAIKLLKKKPIKFSCLFANKYQNYKTVLYHNVQSVNAHLRDIKPDANYFSSNVLILAESWLKPSDCPELPNFTVVFRQDVHRNVPHAYGLILYARTNETCNVMFESSSEGKGDAYNLLAFSYNNYAFCTGYIPPSTPFRDIQDKFAEMLSVAINSNLKIILIGDFNQNVNQQPLSSSVKAFLNVLASNELTNKMRSEKASTDGGTQIDVCFCSSSCNILAGYSESYFSYHKPVLCVLDYTEDREVQSLSILPPQPLLDCMPTKSKKSNHIKIASIEGSRLFEQLKAGTPPDVCLDLIENLTAFVRQLSLYNGKHKNSTPVNENLRKISTTGDGSCFYNSISILLAGSECLTRALRALVSAHMFYNHQYCVNLKHPDVLGDDSTTSSSVLDPNRYAETLEVYILANVLGRNIDTYLGANRKWYRVSSAVPTSKKPPLLVCLEGQHYSALKKVNESFHYSKEFMKIPDNMPNFTVVDCEFRKENKA